MGAVMSRSGGAGFPARRRRPEEAPRTGGGEARKPRRPQGEFERTARWRRVSAGGTPKKTKRFPVRKFIHYYYIIILYYRFKAGKIRVM